MKAIEQYHHDGLGLNDLITIKADDRDPDAGGASHIYAAEIDDRKILRVQFQHGARNVEGSTPGCTEAVLLAVLIDRMEAFQAGPFSCRENAIQLTKLQEVLHWTRHRAEARKRRGVLGENIK